MNAIAWLQLLGLGALCGVLGQGIRVVAGLKKLGDQASSGSLERQAAFSPGQLGVSLLIGATAGALGAISLDLKPAGDTDSQTLATLIGLGYAGADFIEAFMRRSIPTAATPQTHA